MIAELKHRYELDKSSRKFPCPDCKQKTFVRMLDIETGKYLQDHVGRCDRESNCGYHFTAKQYLSEAGLDYVAPVKKQVEEVALEKIDFIPGELLLKSLLGVEQSNFGLYLTNLFGDEIALNALKRYAVGRSKIDDGKATIFWNVDIDQNIRTGKIICYNPESGKRNKEINPTMVHKSYNKEFNLKLAFFGEHLLSEFPDKTIAIVESEKTAIIASIYMPSFNWIATGGASGCKWRDYSVHQVLKDKQIIMFPDFGLFNKTSGKTCHREWTERATAIAERMHCSITVSTVLENNLPEQERANDYDLADMLIKRQNGQGWALTDPVSDGLTGYPAMWDLYKNVNI